MAKTIYNFVKQGTVFSREIRKETSRLASIANKRIKRLEERGLQSSPAYQKWLDEGAEKFGVRGKDFNEVQKELARLRQFIDAKTSTIRGLNSTLKEMARNTGMKYKHIAELQSKANNFFELSSKVEQYLRTVEDMASAIGYQQLWEQINMYVEEASIDLSESEIDIDSLSELVGSVIASKAKGEIEEFDIADDGDMWGIFKK